MDNLTTLQILGTQRSQPQGTKDGACDEIINFRPKDGAWRPIGPYEVLYDKPDYDLVEIHKQDNML